VAPYLSDTDDKKSWPCFRAAMVITMSVLNGESTNTCLIGWLRSLATK